MPLHRLTVPTYFGGLPGTHDYINNATVGTPAPASAQQSGGTYDGTYLEVPGEDATAANVNRANTALAENDDFIDNILYTSRPIPAFDAFTAGGGGDTQIQLTGDAFVGRAGVVVTQEVRNSLMQVVDATTLQPIVDASTGDAIFINDIRDSADAGNVIGTEASGFHTQPIAVFSATIPAATNYRVLHLQRGTVSAESDPSDATGNMGYVSQLIIEAAKRQGAAEVAFAPGLSSWADASSLVATSTQAGLDEVVATLGGTSPGGSLKIGVEAHVSSTGMLDVVAGTLQNQLEAISNNYVPLSGSPVWTGQHEFQDQISLSTIDPFIVDATAGNIDLQFLLGSGSFFINFAGFGDFALRDNTGDPLFEISLGTSTVNISFGEADSGPSDPYDDGAASFRGNPSSVSGQSTHALEVSPGNPFNQDGAPLILNTGGVKGAGFDYGILHMMFAGAGASLANLRRSIIPTQIHRIDDGVGPINLESYDNAGGEWEGRDVLDSTTVLLEAYVVAVGDDGASTAPEDNFGVFVRRARGQRNAGGVRSVSTSSANQIVFEDHSFDESGSAAVVDIVATATGFQIQVTSPSGIGTQDLLWWGYLIMTPLTWTSSPDRVNP